MTDPLQDKDDQWRKRPNSATPVFDPGLSPAGTDAEAGGAPSEAGQSTGGPSRTPMSTSPDAGGMGVRLTPAVWYGIAALLLAVIVIVAWITFA